MCETHDDIKLVFFSSKFDEHYKNLSGLSLQCFPKERILYCSTTVELSDHLTSLLYGLCVVLVVARSQHELSQIYQLKEKLKDRLIILILDSSIDDTAPEAIRLYPRYMTHTKRDYNDILLILNKMVSNIKFKIKGGRNG
ncbi:hypothetical protein [uncultured Desulfobacter sp.]|uniref:hypothetical protein n=1 Tax=uncultured Desulfobacter sp. TaxID=240139 RepID=UPI002AAB7B02|nr:hypothetical protein [uncultured Desulfobacter sp.]